MPFLSTIIRCFSFVLLLPLLVCAQGGIPDPPFDADQYREWNTTYHAQFPAALKALEKDLKANAAAPQLLYQKGVLQLAVGDYAKALKTFESYAKDHLQDDRVLFHMARCHHFSMQYREAYALYKKYSELHPQDPTPLLAIANFLLAANDRPQAMTLSEQIATAFPQSLAAQRNLAECYEQAARLPEALKLYQSIMQKWPAAVEAQQDLVNLYLRLKRVDEAARLAEQATRQFPQSAAAWEALGSVYEQQEKLAEALQAYDTALKLRPAAANRLAPLYTIGYSAVLARNYPLAIQCYQRVLQVDAQDADALFRLGRLYALTGRKKEAEDAQKLLKKQDKTLANQLSKELGKPSQIELAFVNTCAGTKDDPNPPLALHPTILYKEKAKYTDAARQNRIQGTILISAVFTADERITSVRVLRGLPDGLNDEAIKAARKIRFKAACKNGKPVTVRMQMEFSFNLL
ncbi:MAG: TonB family protein [Blastocatellia bacterium]